ncbi:MAG: hypothetical protein KDA28_05810, partial [Phycisphaerales bacterium]|nr:hypothetical protein [Phycisphaerales bacterium]
FNGAAFNVLAGSVGAIRMGTAATLMGGGEGATIDTTNSAENADTFMTMTDGTFNIPGHLYSFIAGSDIEGTSIDTNQILVGGNLGSLHTGLSAVSGIGAEQGDVISLAIDVGGDIGFIDIRGAVHRDHDADGDPLVDSFFGRGLRIRTGLSGEGGDIGVFRTGNTVNGDMLRIVVPAGAEIGAMLISQDEIDAQFPGIVSTLSEGLELIVGPGGDVRFFDTPRIDLGLEPDLTLPIDPTQVFEVTDDGGSSLTIRHVGADATAGFGAARVVPVNGSEGVAIAELVIDMGFGGRVDITSSGQAGDRISIGRITLLNATATSSLRIEGDIEIDVWLVQQQSGSAFDILENNTPGGDFVAVDVAGLNQIFVQQGDLGRTELPSWGPQYIGPFLGIGNGLGGAVGGQLGIPGGVMNVNWNGQLYRPLEDRNYGAGQGYLDDIGSPLDPYLNGAVIRTGDLQRAIIGGDLVNLVLQGAGAELVELIANDDLVTPEGEFHGISGTVFATTINRIEIGDGIFTSLNSPIGGGGIFAVDDIRSIIGNRVAGADIRGAIVAGNQGIQADENNGVDVVSLELGGDFIDAYIASEELDGFWISFNAIPNEGAPVVSGDLFTISGGEGTDFFRSYISGLNLISFEVLGAWDASEAAILGNLTSL